MSLDDYTDDEMTRCWYERRELRDIEKSNAMLIKRMSQGKPPKIGHSYRGLEDMTGQGHKLAEDRYDKALDIVLDFYDGQCMHGVNDEAELASLYASVTKRCKLLALATGLQDEIEAELAAKEIGLGQDKQHHSQSSKRYTSTMRLTEKGARRPTRTTRSNIRPNSHLKSKSHKKAASKKAIPLPSANTLQASKRSVPPAA